jgi:hypothetical protein
VYVVCGGKREGGAWCAVRVCAGRGEESGVDALGAWARTWVWTVKGRTAEGSTRGGDGGTQGETGIVIVVASLSFYLTNRLHRISSGADASRVCRVRMTAGAPGASNCTPHVSADLRRELAQDMQTVLQRRIPEHTYTQTHTHTHTHTRTHTHTNTHTHSAKRGRIVEIEHACLCVCSVRAVHAPDLRRDVNKPTPTATVQQLESRSYFHRLKRGTPTAHNGR